MRRKNDKITQQDIADALGISRNTVSKAINGTGCISDKTKTMVLQKAKELSYQIDKVRVAPSKELEVKNILLLAHQNSIKNPFWTRMASGIDRVTSRNGCNLVLNIVEAQEERAESALEIFTRSQPAGVIIQGPFSDVFMYALHRTGVPMVAMDISPRFAFPNMICDVVMGHNAEAVEIITSRLLDQGHSRIGFVGDIEYALGYMERWEGFVRAHTNRGLKPDMRRCILRPQPEHYFNREEVSDALEKALRDTTAYVCVTDSIAIHLSRALTDLGFNLPEDVAVAGYDNMGRHIFPYYGLTTVNSYPEYVGEKLAELLFLRMENKKGCYCVLRVCTEPIFMESTERCVLR